MSPGKKPVSPAAGSPVPTWFGDGSTPTGALHRSLSARSVVNMGRKKVAVLGLSAMRPELSAAADVQSVGDSENDQHRERGGGYQDRYDRPGGNPRDQHQR